MRERYFSQTLPMSLMKVFDEVINSKDVGNPMAQFAPMVFEPSARNLKLDIVENTNSYVVHAELPGIKKEDVQIFVENDSVKILVEEKKAIDKKEGDTIVHSERYYGKLQRIVRFENDIDAETAKAAFENGVLELTLPKKSVSTVKKVNID